MMGHCYSDGVTTVPPPLQPSSNTKTGPGSVWTLESGSEGACIVRHVDPVGSSLSVPMGTRTSSTGINMDVASSLLGIDP